MCLQSTKKPKLLRAEEDIICWKFVSKITKGYATPFWDSPVKEGATYTSFLALPTKHSNSPYVMYTLEQGLHSFICKDDVIDYLETRGVLGCFYIAKCIIPKGSHYYEGNFYLYRSYASDSIKYIRIRKYEGKTEPINTNVVRCA